MINLVEKELDSMEKKLNDLFSKVSTIVEIEMQSHWSRYLCVLVSGYIEKAFRIIVEDHVKKRAPKEISDYISTDMGNKNTINIEKIRRVLDQFRKNLSTELDLLLTPQEILAINSVVVNRNSIAHGGLTNDLTYSRISNYYIGTKSGVRKLIGLVGKIGDSP